LVPSPRTPSKWPYGGQKPNRGRRVIKTNAAPRGVRRRESAPAAPSITPAQARLALALLLFAGIVAGAYWLYQSPYMTVHEIRVDGASQLPEAHVREIASIEGESAFRVDLRAAEERLLALPQVRTAHIEKHGWTGATITIEERTPWGSWQINGVNVPIDIDGYVLDGVTAAAEAPVIVEVDPQRAIKAGDRLDAGAVQLAARLVDESERTLGRRVVVLAYRQSAGLTAVLSSTDIDGANVWVTFGDSRDYDYKVAALYVLLEQAQEANLKLTAVDLRFGSRLSFN
jgi:cell division protein FtsQ